MNLKEQLYNHCLEIVEKRFEMIQTIITGIQQSLLSETKSTAGDKHETGRAMAQLEQEKAQTEVAIVQSEVKKWQDKYDMAVNDLQMRESKLQRVEMELDRMRTELERTKMAAEKAGSTKMAFESQRGPLEREIDTWKEKHKAAVADVADAEMRFDQIETENARLRCQLQEIEAQRDKLMKASQDFERQEEKFVQEMERSK